MILAISCNSKAFVEIFSVVAAIFNLLYIAIAIGLVVYTMIDFAKVVMSEKVDNGAAFKLFIKKIINVVIALLIIPIVLFVLGALVPDSEKNDTYRSCTDIIIKGLIDPDSLPKNDTGDVEIPKDIRRLQQFQENCSKMNGHYSKVSAKTYDYQDANVIDSYNDGTNVHLCRLIIQ